MKDDEIKRLIDRFLSAREAGTEAYFDAEEIDDMLYCMEENDDDDYYEELLSLGLRLHPENSSLKIRKCRDMIFDQQYKDVLKILDSIGEENNQDVDMLRIECYLSAAMYNKAHRYVDKLIKNNCEYMEEIFEDAAAMLNDFSENGEARIFIEKGLKLFPENTSLKEELCLLCENEGNYTEAIAICNGLIDKNPYSYEHWHTLGRLYSLEESYEKAVEAFDFAITCNESNSELKILKAHCLYMNESYAKAIETYEELRGNEKTWDLVKPLVAECYMKQEDYEQAYKILHPIIYEKTPPNKVHAYINYINCCIETGRNPEGLSIAEKAIGLFPKNTQLIWLRALSLVDKKEDPRTWEMTNAVYEAMERIRNFPKTEFEIWHQIGMFRLEAESANKALVYFRRMEKINPEHPWVKIYIALCLYRMNDMEKHVLYYNRLSLEELKIYNEELARIFNEPEETVFQLPDMPNPDLPEELAKDLLDKTENKN